jgi:Tol biopolymer transport system component
MKPQCRRWTVLAMVAVCSACGREGVPGITAVLGNEPVIIDVSPATVSLVPGSTQQFSATVRTRSGEIIERAPVKWSTADPAVATVTGSGLVTAVATGTTALRATFANDTGTVVVHVETVLRNVLIFSNDSVLFGDIVVMNPDGSGRRRITTDGAGYEAPAISPDGRRIAYAQFNNGTRGIYIMNADGTNRSLLISRSLFDGEPAWSPDGSQIAFRSLNSGPFGDYGRIFVINVDGTGLHQVSPEETDPNAYSFDASPSWSPDGSRIAFDRTGQTAIINADGTGLTLIGGGEHPSWSPDGTRFAFEGVSEGTTHIYVCNADGSNPVRITNSSPNQENTPHWSPDSRRIVFNRVADDFTFQIYVINADGTGEVSLSHPGGGISDSWPNWSPLP